MKSKRIAWLDFGKGFAIFFVVLFHCIQAASPKSFLILNIIGSFIMPIFFAISGFLYKPRSSDKNYFLLLYKKISSFLIPYIIFCIFMEILNDSNMLSFTPWESDEIHIYDMVFMIHGAGGYLWFLFDLFLIFIIADSINYLINGNNLYIKILSIVFILGSLFFGRSYGLPNFLCWIVCFAIGYVCNRYKLFTHINILQRSCIPLIVIWIALFYFQYTKENSGELANASDFFSKVDIITKFTSIFVFFTIFVLWRNNAIFKFFCKYGKYTLIIYLVHFPIAIMMDNILRNFINLNIFYGLIVFIITWCLSLGICKLVNSIKWLNFIFYPRKYINKFIYNTKLGKYLFN